MVTTPTSEVNTAIIIELGMKRSDCLLRQPERRSAFIASHMFHDTIRSSLYRISAVRLRRLFLVELNADWEQRQLDLDTDWDRRVS